MKYSRKYLSTLFIVLLSITFSNCTAWPAIAALLMGGKSGGGGMLLLPPGGSDEVPATPALTSNIVLTTATVSSYYPATTVIDINVKFTESVEVTGFPRLRLNNLVDVNYLSGSGSDTLVFRYTVQAGNNEDVIGLETTSQTALSLNGGTIKSTATTNNMSLILPVPGSTNSFGSGKVIVIDTTPPTITNVTSSTSNGVYGAGGDISIQVTFSETINVLAANPQLTLETGTPDRDADCAAGTEITTLTCTYTVFAGDASSDLDYLATNSLGLNGSTIRDAAGNDANLTLAAPGATNSLGANKAIVIDTSVPNISFALASSSGAESTSPTLTVNISSAPLTADASVPYSVTGGTASGTDYTLLGSGTLTWTVGDGAAKTITLNVVDDALDENPEDIVVTLGIATAASVGAPAAHTYTINDNDAPPTVAFDATISNASEATTTFNIPVSISTASGLSVTVDYSVTGGTATSGGTDFTLAAGTLTFVAGVTTQNISVTVNNDALDEVNETIVIDISNPGNASLGTNTSHTYTITDDDAAPTVAFSGTTSSGSEVTTAVNIPVTLSAASSQTVTVNYAVTGGTATSGGTDYTLAAGTLTFVAGDTSENIVITVNNDSLYENNETIIIDLSGPTNSTLGGNTTHTYTITNDDSAPTVAFTATTSNGLESVAAPTLAVTLSAASGLATTVDYAVTGGTATSGGTDFTLAAGTLTFNAGVTTQNITLAIVNDTINETNETIQITLSNPTNSTLGTNTVHTYTITDNDTAPTVAFTATTSNADESTTAVTIPVTLSGNSTAQTVTVGYSVTGGTATSGGTDFTLAAGTLTFVAGDTSEDISITINNDVLDEANETIQITLASPTVATLGTNTVHTYTINDDDPTPTVAFNATTSNAGEATTAVTIPVSLSAASGQTVTVGYSVTGGTATGTGTDFTLAAGTLTFVAGDTSEDISITVNNDTATELDETIIITLATPTNSTLGTNTIHTYTINDNDPPTVAFSATTSNGSESATTVTIPVTLSGAYSQAVTVGYSVTGGTATSGGTDFTLAAGTLTFNPGTTSQDISIAVVNDALDEVNETIQITLASPTVATLGTNTVHTYTINDDDPTPTVAFNATTSNGGEATTAVTIPVSLSAASGQTVTVGYSVTGGTATSGGTDFTLAAGTLTFVAGDTSEDISITINNDSATELDETIIITLATPTNSTLGTNTIHTYTINDNDPPTVAFTTTTGNGSEATTAVTIPVTLSGAYSQTVTVGYSVTGGTATDAGTDFTLAAGTLTFVAGDTSEDINLAIVNDTISESSETITITLASPTVATLGTNTTHTYTILDNDTPDVIFSSASSNGSEATTSVNIPVTLSFSSANTVTVDYSVTGGTATDAGTDFTLAAGTLTFVAGDTSENINIAINNDALDEINETIVLTITNSTNAVLGATTSHTYTINDDDPTPSLSINNVTVTEGNSGTINANFTVTLSAASSQTVTVDYATSNATATAGSDYTAITASTLTFNPGETTKPVAVVVTGDALHEVDETFSVTLSNVSATATIGTATGTGTITNDDAIPSLSINNATVTEGNSGTVNANFTVTLSAASGQTVTVDYATSNVTATAGSDYTAITTTALTFNPGETTKPVVVVVAGDSLHEVDETFSVTLSNVSATATIATATGTGTITNDDATPSLSINNASVTEGNSGTVNANFTVTLSAASGQTVTVDYATSNVTAASGSDYTAITTTTLTFNPGETTKPVSVVVSGDLLHEGNETFSVTLSNVSATATIGTATGTGTITNDDAIPSLSINNVTVTEGNSGTVNANFTVTLSAASGQTVTVDYATSNVTATAGSDYTAITTTTLTFNPGETTKPVPVVVAGDALNEVDETFSVTLSNVSATATIGTATGTGTITNDDVIPTLSINDVTVTEGNSGTVNANFTVTLSAASGQAVTVDYATSNVTATAGSDYTAITTTTLTFNPGETTKPVTVVVNGDTLHENDETFTVTISNVSTTATIVTATGTGTITNDETPPTVQFALSLSSSGNESSTTRNIEVTLSAASALTVTATVTDSGGTATSGTDYTAIGSPLTVTFTAGVTSQNVSIPVLQDLDFEGDETVQLTLSAPSNATLGGTTGHTLTITEDDVGIVSAETLDADNDGKIDHYKLTFSEAVNDSTFPGYVLDTVGTAQTDWLVAGYSGVTLAHGAAAPESDTTNDEVIYLKFAEGVSSDTDAKPNLTTTATPALIAMSAKTIGRVYTATVVEADRAKPVILSATAQAGTTLITLSFSEPVWTASGMPACTAGGDLIAGDFIYNDVSATSSSSVSSMGADICGTDMVVTVNTNTALMPSDNGVDTIVATVGIFDAANNNGNPTARVINATGGPMISSVELYDTDKNGKIDQAKIVFTITVSDATIDDADASRFLVAGTAAVKVDTASSGTGVIASPNNDPGVANDNTITILTDDFSVLGTDLKLLSFTQNAGRWMGNGTELLTNADLTSVTVDKAPPVILTAVAAENTNAVAGVDSDDTIEITFSEPTNKPTINSGNIASIFSLSGSHVWGNLTSAAWNGPGDVLTLTFAGTGSPTVAVGDYITILGTIADTATIPNTSVNIQSVNPISGNFSVQAPSVSSASSTSATTLRVVFSEDVNNTDAVTLGYYKIALSSGLTGNCSDNSNFTGATANLTISAIVKVDDRTYDFTTSSQTNGTSYTLLAHKSNIRHKDYSGYSLTCPNNANFIGQEKLRVTSVSCTSLTSLVVTFSKPVNTGMNLAGSAECNTTTECDKRYVIKGIVSGTEVGSLTQAKVTDGTVCGGEPSNSSKVCITHALNQNGSIYTLVAANNTNSDGFDDTSWGAIQSTAENLQASPKDRASFTGCGTSPQNFIDGPVVTDPFGDGTTFGFLNKYQSKIYIGPNQKGNGATRFNADGSSPENLTFELLKDTTVNAGSATNRVSSSTAAAPFSSIGYTGCTLNDATATGCGPNNENGRGLFATGTFSGTEYLFITGANTAGNNDYLYYTPDLDSVLNFNYMDASEVFDNYATTCTANWASGVTQNQVTESIHVFNGKIYWSVPGDGTNRPFAVKIGTLTSEINCDDTNNAYLNMRYMSGVGRLHATKPAQADIMGGIFNSFNDRLYFANSGSISYSKVSSPVCIEGSTYSAGVCEQTGGIVRSINNNPAGCTSAGGCPDWVDITPSSTDYKKYFTIGLEAISDLIPAQRPIPSMETYKNNFYFIRNACTQALWDDGTAAGGDSNNGCAFNNSCGTTNKNDKTCPAGSEIPQLWKCDPTLTGGSTECDSGDWTLVAQNGTTGKTNFGDANNTKVTMLSTNGDYLYVGFDNATTGIEVWRTNVADPSTEGNFSQIGGDGFGSGTALTEIYSNIALQNGSIHYIYASIGKNSIPVRVHRQQNEAEVVFMMEKMNQLLAYLNQANSQGYAAILLGLIISILGYFYIRKLGWLRIN
ncbi:MAG: hypothetical protein IPL26_15540 [Leptospiraceae bacterium]|nr:hypothetical protein [Leptospiraceae bacterium]